MVVKGLSKLRHKKAAWSLGTVPNGGTDVQILGFFGDEFHKENLHFRGWNVSQLLNLVQGFLLRRQQKNICFLGPPPLIIIFQGYLFQIFE